MRLNIAMHRAFATACALLLLALAALVATPRQAHAAPQLPAGRLEFGLSNGPSSVAWLTGSGVPWKYRYTYIAGGVCWSGSAPGCSDWLSWQDPALPPGQYPIDYVDNTPAGTIPVFPYYMLLQSNHPNGVSESDADYANLNNPALMSAYYANFALLLQRINSTGRQTVVHVEPDLWGYLQQRSNNTTADQLGASVASSGYGPVAAYPNTAQGFGQALLHLRDLYAANTVTLAVHASLWSSKVDVGSSVGTVDAPGEAAKTARFLNSTGSWDAVFDDVDDHDAGWWEQQGADNQWFTHWWNPTITDPGSSTPNFPRYLSWVKTLRSLTGKPQVAWQIPEGNQVFLTENNTCGHYQDDVAQWFLAHPIALYSAGLVAVLFGAGNGCQTTNEDSQGDGTTNNNGLATVDAATSAWCSGCNKETSVYSDDDGGFLRLAVGRYYSSSGSENGPSHERLPGFLATPPPAPSPTAAAGRAPATAVSAPARQSPAPVSSGAPPVSSGAPPALVPRVSAARPARAPYDPSRLVPGQPL